MSTPKPLRTVSLVALMVCLSVATSVPGQPVVGETETLESSCVVYSCDGSGSNNVPITLPDGTQGKVRCEFFAGEPDVYICDKTTANKLCHSKLPAPVQECAGNYTWEKDNKLYGCLGKWDKCYKTTTGGGGVE